MRLADHLGHIVAWTRGALLASLAFGCSFSDYTKTSPALEPACTEAPRSETGILPLVYWTFDDAADPSAAFSWLDTDRLHPLQPKSEPNTTLPTFAPSRLNGEGNAIAFDGHQYASYQSDAAVSGDGELFKGDFTISAWLSLPAGGVAQTEPGTPIIWPILSTLGGPGLCSGYQLDLRIEDDATGPELVFSYQYANQQDAGDACDSHQLRHSVDNPPWVWGTGRWHHVAASLGRAGADQSSLSLYWDGVRLNASNDTVTSGHFEDSHLGLYVGTNAAGAESMAPKFKGTLDEIAIFKNVLTDKQVRDFAFANTTRPGPANCQWMVSEQWDDFTQTEGGSVASWAPDSNPRSLEVEVTDSDWGAGIVSAHVSPPRDLAAFGSVHLQASVPNEYANYPNGGRVPIGSYQFSIENGRDYCTWILAADGSTSHTIPLDQPSYCASSNCQFPITSIDWMRITTGWKDIGLAPQRLTVTGLDLSTEGHKIDPDTYGGAIGPNGWCWRPMAYEIGAAARFSDIPSTAGMAAVLTGNESSSSRVTADFGSQVLDLSGCASVNLEGTLPPLLVKYTLGLQDIQEAWMDWDIQSTPSPDGTFEIVLDPKFASASSENATADPSYRRFPRFDIHRVNQLGIQKPWSYRGSLKVEIRKVQFRPEKCEHWNKP